MEPVGSFGSAYDGLVTWDAWIGRCDALVALMADGRMTDDFDYDWRDAFAWGESVQDAVMAAVMRGVQDD